MSDDIYELYCERDELTVKVVNAIKAGGVAKWWLASSLDRLLDLDRLIRYSESGDRPDLVLSQEDDHEVTDVSAQVAYHETVMGREIPMTGYDLVYSCKRRTKKWGGRWSRWSVYHGVRRVGVANPAKLG